MELIEGLGRLGLTGPDPERFAGLGPSRRYLSEAQGASFNWWRLDESENANLGQMPLAEGVLCSESQDLADSRTVDAISISRDPGGIETKFLDDMVALPVPAHLLNLNRILCTAVAPDERDRVTLSSPADFEERQFRDVVGHFASGLTLVTGVEGGRPHGLTCQSFFSVSLDPPLVAIAPSKASQSWPEIARNGMICINVLAADQAELARTFSKSGIDKFLDLGWSSASNGAPRIGGALAWIDCHIENMLEAGDHYLVVARVMAIEGTPDPGEPLLFYRGSLGSFDSVKRAVTSSSE